MASLGALDKNHINRLKSVIIHFTFEGKMLNFLIGVTSISVNSSVVFVGMGIHNGFM